MRVGWSGIRSNWGLEEVLATALSLVDETA